MTNRELLEAAAKAAGIERVYYEYLGEWGLIDSDDGDGGWWNPLKDDGDALRLVVQLGIHLQFAMDFSVAYAGTVHAKQFTERSGLDPFAATRLAIVKAAAEMAPK